MLRLAAWFAAACVLACGSDDAASDADAALAPQNCATDERAPTFEVGLRVSGSGGTTVELVEATPMPAARNDNRWTIRVTDEEGTPVSDLSVTVDPRMPDHGHGTSVAAVVTAAAAPGEYDVDPIYLWMPGYWEIGFVLEDEGGGRDSAILPVCIEP